MGVMMNKAGQWSQHEMGFCEAQGSKEAFFTFATSSGSLRDLISFLETPSFKMRYVLLCVPEILSLLDLLLRRRLSEWGLRHVLLLYVSTIEADE
jgi:hypothetical protein